MTGKNVLQKTRKLRIEITRSVERIERLESAAARVTSILSSEPRAPGFSTDRTASYAIVLSESRERLASLQAEFNDISQMAWNIISQARDETIKTMLIDRYMIGLSWERVARLSGYATADSARKICDYEIDRIFKTSPLFSDLNVI